MRKAARRCAGSLGGVHIARQHALARGANSTSSNRFSDISAKTGFAAGCAERGKTI